MITSQQCRGLRGWFGLNIQETAELASISHDSVWKIEAEKPGVSDRIRNCLEIAFKRRAEAEGFRVSIADGVLSIWKVK